MYKCTQIFRLYQIVLGVDLTVYGAQEVLEKKHYIFVQTGEF